MISSYYRGHEKDARGNITIRGNFYGYYYSICTGRAHTVYSLFLYCTLLFSHESEHGFLSFFHQLSEKNTIAMDKMKENL